ncbi:MAG: dipeptidase [Syntrophomonas sp.]
MKIVDLHCDTVSETYNKIESLWENKCHFDIKRALKAGVVVQFFALFTMPADCNTALRKILKQLDKLYQEMERYSDYIYPVFKAEDIDIEENHQKIGGIIHLEGGEALGTDPEILRTLYRLGLRSLGLTWNQRNYLADGVAEGEGAGGLSLKGREILKEMNRLGIILDLSHISEKAFFDALEYCEKPLMVTHANAQAVCNHCRNLSDRQLKTLADHGGVVGLNQVSSFVKEGKANIDDFLDHAVYIADLIGSEFIALGSDFDGAENIVLPGVEGYMEMEQHLYRRGFNKEEAEMILGANALRVIKTVL